MSDINFQGGRGRGANPLSMQMHMDECYCAQQGVTIYINAHCIYLDWFWFLPIYHHIKKDLANCYFFNKLLRLIIKLL
jgi:hypothetical protein